MPGLVTEADARPAGRPDRCFYCGSHIGAEHGDTCVADEVPVVVRVTIEVEMQMPRSWDKGLIEFNLNDGSRCATNTIDLLQSEGCACAVLQHEFLRTGKLDS